MGTFATLPIKTSLAATLCEVVAHLSLPEKTKQAVGSPQITQLSQD